MRSRLLAGVALVITNASTSLPQRSTESAAQDDRREWSSLPHRPRARGYSERIERARQAHSAFVQSTHEWNAKP
jgi:hypothetical protein